MGRVVRFHEFGGPEVLRIEEGPSPEPGPGEVRIRVKALGINRAEALMRSARYIETPPLPSGLGLEAAGVVDKVGPGVDTVSVGDGVSVVPPRSMVRWPAYGDVAIFPANLLIRHPPSLSWVEAAAVWMQYLTAYGALVDVAGLKAGEFVIITAASSSVGLAAIQIANAVGAIPVAVTRTTQKARPLEEAGAAHVIASCQGDLEARLRRVVGPKGARLVFDPVGGPIFEPLTAVMAEGGILIEYGGLSTEPTPLPLFRVLSGSLQLRGYRVYEITDDPERLESAKAFILAGLASGALRPIIDRVFPFDRIAEAHRHLESNQQFGKIVVTV